MPTNKKRIQIYINEKTIKKFRVISALKGYKSMSEYAGKLVEKSIQDYESKHGEIQLENEHMQGRGGKRDNYPIILYRRGRSFGMRNGPKLHPSPKQPRRRQAKLIPIRRQAYAEAIRPNGP